MWRYIFDDSCLQMPSHAQRRTLTRNVTGSTKTSPETGEDSASNNTTTVEDRHCSPTAEHRDTSPKRRQEDESSIDVTGTSDSDGDESDEGVTEFLEEQPVSNYTSPGQKADSTDMSESAGSHAHSKQCGSPQHSAAAADALPTLRGCRDSDGHKGSSTGDRTSLPGKRGEKHFSRPSQRLSSTDQDRNASASCLSSCSGTHEDCSSYKHSVSSAEVQNPAGSPENGPASDASLEKDYPILKPHPSSHSNKADAISSDTHSSRSSDRDKRRNHKSGSDRRASGGCSVKGDLLHSQSHHERQSDGHKGALKIYSPKKEACSGNETKKSLSVQFKDDGHNRRHSHLSSISEEDGSAVEVSTSAGYITSPDLLSEKENKLSERRSSTSSTNTQKHSERRSSTSSTNAQKEEEMEQSVRDSGTSKNHPSKSGDVKSRRRSSSESQSSSSHKSHKATGSRKHHIEIRPITVIVNETSGYVTSPDISSEEDDDDQEDKSGEETPVSVGLQRRASTNSQTGDEVQPVSLTKHQLKPNLERQGGSYTERLKVIEKLMAVKQKMEENEQGYHRKRAARGEVKKRRARREKLEGDFSGSCRDKIEYNLEDKPSLKRPEPKPEEPKPEKCLKKEKPEKERKEHKDKKDRRKAEEKQKSRRSSTDRTKPRTESGRTDRNRQASKADKKQRSRSASVLEGSAVHMSGARRSRKDMGRTSSLAGPDQQPSPPTDVPDQHALQKEFLKMKSVWDAVFSKSKSPGDCPSVPTPAPDTPESETDDWPPAVKKRKMTDDSDEGEDKKSDIGEEPVGQD